MKDHDLLLDDLLQSLIDFPVTGYAADSYQRLADQISGFLDGAHVYLLVARPFTTPSHTDLAYTVYCSRIKDAAPPSTTEVSYAGSMLLQTLDKDGSYGLALDRDPVLQAALQGATPDGAAPVGLVAGFPVSSNGLPLAYILTDYADETLFASTGWSLIRKVVRLAVDRLFYLYEEKARQWQILMRIAERLQDVFDSSRHREEEILAADPLQRVLDCTRKILEAEKCALFLVDYGRKSLVLERASGEVNFEQIRLVATYDIANYDPAVPRTGVTPWVLYRKRPFNARNFWELQHNSERHWKGNWDVPMYGGGNQAETKFQCAYMVPLMAGDEAIGVLKYENRTTPEKGFFDQAEERVIDLIGQLITILIISQRIDRNRYDYALPRISNTITSHIGQPTFFERLLDECRLILNADLSSLFLVDSQDNLYLKAVSGVGEESKAKLGRLSYGNYRTAKGLTPWVLQRKASFNARSFPDLRGRSEGHHVGVWDEMVYHNDPAHEFRCLYSTPLIIGGKAIGVFKIESKNVTPYYFTESDERLFDLIGRLITIGVLYEDAQYVGLMLRAAEMGFLAAGIAHEFKNHLQAFQAMADTIGDLSDEPELQSAVESLTARIKSSSDTIDSFGLIRSRKQEVERFRVEPLVRQVVDFTRQRFKTHAIEASVSSEGVDEVELSPAELQTIVVNLLNNAFEAIEGSGRNGHIEISIRREAPASFSIAVLDDGPGIAPEVRDCLFAPFVTTKLPEGMGIGLFLVQRVVTAMGGQVKVDSPPPGRERGALFRVTLPISITGGTSDA